MSRLTRSTNPALTKEMFTRQTAASTSQTSTMTIEGTVNKTLIMFLLLAVGAYYTWRLFFNAGTMEAGASAVVKWIAIGGIGGFITAIVTVFKKTWASITAPIYAVLEGLFIGGLSAFFEARFPGIVMQAVALTFGVLLVLLAAYKSGIIKVTQKFRAGVVAATGAVALVYLLSIILQLFGVQVVLFQPTWVGIGISIVIVIIAALNLVLDFDFIYQGSKAGAPKHLEWYGAFGLILTLVWLYIEILRLLSLLAGRE